MVRKFIPLLVLVTALELGGLIWVGFELGALSTIYYVILTGFVGISVMGSHGRALKQQYEKMMGQLGMMRPPEELGGQVSGRLLAMLGGILVAFPGLVTDFIGLLLLLPPVRKALASRAKKALESLARSGALPNPANFAGGKFPGGAGGPSMFPGFGGWPPKPGGPGSIDQGVIDTTTVDASDRK